MKTIQNNNFKVTFTSENEFTVQNVFGDRYKCYLDENGKICSKQRFGLQYAMKARKELNF